MCVSTNMFAATFHRCANGKHQSVAVTIATKEPNQASVMRHCAGKTARRPPRNRPAPWKHALPSFHCCAQPRKKCIPFKQTPSWVTPLKRPVAMGKRGILFSLEFLFWGNPSQKNRDKGRNPLGNKGRNPREAVLPRPNPPRLACTS